MQVVACSHAEAQQQILFSAQDYISGDPFVLTRCTACGLVRTTPLPPPARLARYYPAGYYGEHRRYSPPLERALDRLYDLRARRIAVASGLRQGRVLDVGCGRGQLLDHLRRRGWEVLGTELSDESARYSREVLKIEVRTGSLVDLALPAAAFDTVILWHVLEHLPDPAALLREVARVLRPGGTFLVAVPNFGSPEARWARAGWFHLDVPRHLVHFTPASLRAQLRDAGLQPYHASYFAAEYDVFSFVQTVLNVLGLRHNLLYNLLRTRGAKVLAEGRQRPAPLADVALTLLLAPLLGLISLAWVPLVAQLGRGATMTVYARKPRV